MATMVVRRSIRPQFLLSFVAVVGISFFAGERVGVRLATARVVVGPANVTSGSESSLVRQPGSTEGATALDVAQAPGIPPDCNPNYR